MSGWSILAVSVDGKVSKRLTEPKAEAWVALTLRWGGNFMWADLVLASLERSLRTFVC